MPYICILIDEEYCDELSKVEGLHVGQPLDILVPCPLQTAAARADPDLATYFRCQKPASATQSPHVLRSVCLELPKQGDSRGSSSGETFNNGCATERPSALGRWLSTDSQ